MTPELIKLQEAIKKKPRHNKRHNRSAGIDKIREAFKEYKKSLDKSWWERLQARLK